MVLEQLDNLLFNAYENLTRKASQTGSDKYQTAKLASTVTSAGWLMSSIALVGYGIQEKNSSVLSTGVITGLAAIGHHIKQSNQITYTRVEDMTKGIPTRSNQGILSHLIGFMAPALSIPSTDPVYSMFILGVSTVAIGDGAVHYILSQPPTNQPKSEEGNPLPIYIKTRSQ